MNILTATVREIRSSGSLHLVYFDLEGHTLVMTGLETDAAITPGRSVQLGIKPTAIALAHAGDCRAFANRLPGIVQKIEAGELLTSVGVTVGERVLEVIMLRMEADALALESGAHVTVLFMASALSIQGVADA